MGNGTKSGASLYDSDFYLWTQKAAEQLREGRLGADDLEHASEELADMGKRDRRELQSRMIVLLQHLIKWAAQPTLRDTSTWLATINEQRTQIEGVLDQSPSLRAFLELDLASLYNKATKQAAIETRIPVNTLKTALEGAPLALDRLLCEDFLPDALADLAG
jgi:Domain of unknown function DUF29